LPSGAAGLAMNRDKSGPNSLRRGLKWLTRGAKNAVVHAWVDGGSGSSIKAGWQCRAGRDNLAASTG
jgi:hypothetical protein